MISALLLVNKPANAPNLVPDLQAAGVAVQAALETGHKLVQATVRHQPDVLICDVAKTRPRTLANPAGAGERNPAAVV
jgi:AmiR/NasT family two-component response regulator